MALKSIKTKRGFFGIQSDTFEPVRKVTIAGVDISDDIVDCNFKLPNQSSAGTINLKINNKDGKYTRDFAFGDIIKLYVDYADGSYQLWEYRLYKPTYSLTNGFMLNIFGMDYSADAHGPKIFRQDSSAIEIKTIIEELIAEYLPNHSQDYTSIATTGTTKMPEWNGVSVFDCFKEMLGDLSNNYFIYCDINKKWHLFEKGSQINQTAGIIYGVNMIDCNVNDGDLSKMFFREIVNGKQDNGLPHIYTANNQTLEDSYIRRDKIISDTTLQNTTEVKNKADSLLSIDTSTEKSGSVSCVGLHTLSPGDSIPIICPICNIMTTVNLVDVTHTFNSGGFRTTVSFQEAEKGVASILAERIKKEDDINRIDNPFGMRYSEVYTITGDTIAGYTDIVSYDNTTIWDSAFMQKLDTAEGWAIFKTINSDITINGFTVKIAGENLQSEEGEQWIKVLVSCDNGSNWVEASATNDTEHTLDSAYKGNQIKIKIIVNSLSVRIRGVSVLWK